MTLTAAQVQAKKSEITAPGAFFELETVTLDGRDYPAYKHAPKTMIEVLQNARNHGDLEFLVYQGRRYTFSQFYAQVDALAATLQQRHGVQAGDRVAIAMRNNPEWGMAYVAATLIGAIVVPINSWGKTEELRYALSDSEAKVVVSDVARFELIAHLLDELKVEVLLVGGGEHLDAAGVYDFEQALTEGAASAFQLAQPQPTDICVILYTSGSTGFPKGVMHRHIAVCQSLMNMMWLGMLLFELEGPREFRGGAERETPLLTVPLFHATGLLSGFLMPLQLGHKAVMMYKWDALQALQLIETERVTSFSSVPAIVQDLLGRPEFDQYDTSSLLRVTGAGAATPTGLPELINAKCNNPSRSAGWGMTETVAVGSTMSGAIYDLRPDSAGVQAPIMAMRMVDKNGRELAKGEQGELQVYGVTCMAGYWNKPEANAKTFTADGWMETGDIARFDADDFLYITGRSKEIVIRGGENIYPGEIESVAYQLDQVQENVVFGVPDAAMGEELVMVAYVPAGKTLDAAGLRQHMSERLAGYKVPRYIQVVHQPLPRNASEKLHKLKVKEAYLAKQ